MKKSIIIFSVILASCGGVKIKQEYSIDSYCTNMYHVSTKVVVKDKIGATLTIEYWNSCEVPESKIDSALQAGRVLAYPVYSRVVNCYY